MGNQLFTDGVPDEIPDYYISIKSGNQHKIGSASSISISFVNTDGEKSNSIEYTRKDVFKPGTVITFPVYNTPNLGQLDTMELIELDGGSWYVQWVEVMDSLTKETFTFPVHRWMNTNQPITLKLYDTLLPQNDDNTVQRKQELERKKEHYEFSFKLIPGAMPRIRDTPSDEEFPKNVKDDFNKLKRSLILQALVNYAIPKTWTYSWTTLADTDNVYGGIFVKPNGIGALSALKEDHHFGRRRLLGCNPCLFRLCEQIPKNLKVTNQMLQPIIEDLTIEDAIKKKKLYIINLENLVDIPCKREEDKKRICAPIALFFVNKDKEFVPVAIQLNQNPAEDNPIFLPTDPEYTWMLAKMWFLNADSMEHQSATHLGLTHLLMESVCVATHRCLSPSHPIFRLLIPHLFGVIAINTKAATELLNPGGFTDSIQISGLVGVYENIRRAWQTWRLDTQGNLPNDLKDRGVDDPEALPNYHYRDDGMLYWTAIKKYVKAVVEGHYGNLEMLEGDTEIQEWAETLTSRSDGCGMKGVPGDGRFSTCDELVDTVTSFIYISSVVHAAVNSPQYEMYSSPLGCIHLKGLPPTDKRPVGERDIIATLQTRFQILKYNVLFYALSTQGPHRLGDPEMEYQFDPIGMAAFTEFRKDVKAIGEEIEARNIHNAIYTYLLPKKVTNSIGI